MKSIIRIVINPEIEKTTYEILDNYNGGKIIEISLKPYTNFEKEFANINKEASIKNIEYISFTFYNKYFEYIKEEKIIMAVNNFLLINKEYFQSEKIVLPKTYSWSADISEIKEKYKNFNNILINVEGNVEPITLEEFEQSQKIYKSIINSIKNNNYSPLEKTLLIYDIVRSYKYDKEDEEELFNNSRDISKILLYKKIVCTGYANLVRQLLNECNIRSNIYRLKEHDLVMLYLKDKKYNINGIYLLDPTAERRRNNNNYLYHYKYFLKTRDDMLENYCYEKDETLGALDHLKTDELSKIAKQILEGNDFLKKIELQFTIDRLSRLVSKHRSDILENNIDLNEIKYYQELLNKRIYLDKFSDALQIINQNEYYKERNIVLTKDDAIDIGIDSQFYEKETIRSKIAKHPLIKKLTKNSN